MPRPVRLTTPDLVVLSLLSEGPLHGYDLYQELLRRDVEDWAVISRPQVYYSLRKLEKLGMTRPIDGGRSEGPERRTYAPSVKGRRALSKALGRPEWTTQRPPPPFLTWATLSWNADRETIERQIDRRRGFLAAEIAREETTRTAIRAELEHRPSVPEQLVALTIKQFQLELSWLDRLESVALAACEPEALDPVRTDHGSRTGGPGDVETKETEAC